MCVSEGKQRGPAVASVTAAMGGCHSLGVLEVTAWTRLSTSELPWIIFGQL